MAEYIKLDVALKALCQVSAPTPSESYIVEKCIEKINGLQMIEVVQCKECYKLNTSWCPMDPRRMRLRDFCSYGERRKQ